MVNKLLTAVFALVVGVVIAVLLTSGGTKPPVPPQEKVVLEMTMYPIEGSDGEYMLEYREDPNGPVIRREILKKDGQRHPVGEVTNKDKK